MDKSDINVLIVDDDNSQREALNKAVTRRGYKAIAVAKPEEAESIIRLKPIHALIVDCMLPGKSGVDLVVGLREKVLDAAPVFLISGIYRDKTFSTDAIQRTGAAEFYLKPFNIEELLASLEKKLSVFVKAPKVGLQTLLSAPLSSERDRRRALDYVDALCGYDLPFIFSILMDSKATGHLNIIDKSSNIYGVSFNQGTILGVDSESTGEITQKTLLEKGYITADELKEVSGVKGSELSKALVEKGVMSPHAQDIVKDEQIIKELNLLVNDFPIKINFVHNRSLSNSKLGIGQLEFLPQMTDMVSRLIPITYLKKFYSEWTGHSLKRGPNYSEHARISHLPLLIRLPGIIERIAKEPFHEELLADANYREEDFFRGLHLLSIFRVVVFTETAQVRNLDDYVIRIKNAYEAVKDQDPVGVFKYFGLSAHPKAHEVAQTYKEFAKTNHPDLVPQAATPEVRGLNHKLFAKVTNAHDILTNDEKKEAFYSKVKQDELAKQMRAEDSLAEAYAFLTRGRFIEAKTRTEQARVNYMSDKARLYHQWALIKIAKKPQNELVSDALKDLDEVTVEGKKTALFAFVKGLTLKAAGRPAEALKLFDRARKLDPNFTDARREITAIRADIPKKMDINEILNGDLGTVISNLFKKKGA